MKRLDKIVSLLKGYDVACDIGSDHGYVIKRAIDLGYIKRGIVSEIAEGPLSNAKQNLINYPVTFYLSDGFDKITEDFDIGIIAGMGVYTIQDILTNAPKKRYILQANDKVEILREFLVNHNYKIIDEFIVFERFYYIILVVEPGYEILSNEDIYLGPHLKLKTGSRKYYQQKLEHLELIMLTCDPETKEKLNKYTTFLKKVNT